ncbi:transposase [Streptomyces avermitilis]|uniref:transposase n=1 Tax=Streptomyces avermitilis TaxID=33903 RepID=UPI00381B2349
MRSPRPRAAAEEHRRHPRQAETPGQARRPHRGRRRQLHQEAVASRIPATSTPAPNLSRKRTSPHEPTSETYKRRNLVERSFNLLKQWRGLATRYDELAVVHRSAAVPAAVITWPRSAPA